LSDSCDIFYILFNEYNKYDIYIEEFHNWQLKISHLTKQVDSDGNASDTCGRRLANLGRIICGFPLVPTKKLPQHRPRRLPSDYLFIFGNLAKLRKANMSLVMSVRPSARIEQLGAN